MFINLFNNARTPLFTMYLYFVFEQFCKISNVPEL